jgi:hypothetical protein
MNAPDRERAISTRSGAKVIARPKLLDQFASEPAADQCKTGPNGGENGGGDLRLRRIRGSDGQAACVEGKDDPVHDSMD